MDRSVSKLIHQNSQATKLVMIVAIFKVGKFLSFLHSKYIYTKKKKKKKKKQQQQQQQNKETNK